jgi:hypothetical protein
VVLAPGCSSGFDRLKALAGSGYKSHHPLQVYPSEEWRRALAARTATIKYRSTSPILPALIETEAKSEPEGSAPVPKADSDRHTKSCVFSTFCFKQMARSCCVLLKCVELLEFCVYNFIYTSEALGVLLLPITDEGDTLALQFCLRLHIPSQNCNGA